MNWKKSTISEKVAKVGIYLGLAVAFEGIVIGSSNFLMNPYKNGEFVREYNHVKDVIYSLKEGRRDAENLTFYSEDSRDRVIGSLDEEISMTNDHLEDLEEDPRMDDFRRDRERLFAPFVYLTLPGAAVAFFSFIIPYTIAERRRMEEIWQKESENKGSD